MAKKAKGEAGSIQGYFRPIFAENPRLLKQRSNDALYERWLRDHPGEKEVPLRVKQGLSNLKSVLRNRRRRRRRVRGAEPAAADVGLMRRASAGGTRGGNALVRLESQIDEALVLARQLESQALDDVIRLLRSARNRVIVQLG
jgi:hypothetical protein